MVARETQGMAAIGGSVSLLSAFFPRSFLSLFGVAPREVTSVAVFALRLFSVRTAYLSMLAFRGDTAARDAFLPVEVLDQLVFWHAFKTRSIPRPGAVLAAAVSGAIIALDLKRRRSRPSSDISVG